MAEQLDGLTDQLTRFIEAQQIFFVATAATQGRVNISPKGMDSLRVLSPNRVIWLNVTGSGNETAAHLLEMPRMTIMFAGFEAKPLILRLYGQARAIHHTDPEWEALSAKLPALPGARQIFDLDIDMVQTSCGYAVPFYDFVGERDTLKGWAEKRGDDGIADYWRDKNQTSIDGLPTQIVEANGLSDKSQKQKN
ncbi:MAG: pyridoxamine 5'-phosphate oxidase family protein [Alphaproteobacteria bacterium]